jgi:hypothetical protein
MLCCWMSSSGVKRRVKRGPVFQDAVANVKQFPHGCANDHHLFLSAFSKPIAGVLDCSVTSRAVIAGKYSALRSRELPTFESRKFRCNAVLVSSTERMDKSLTQALEILRAIQVTRNGPVCRSVFEAALVTQFLGNINVGSSACDISCYLRGVDWSNGSDSLRWHGERFLLTLRVLERTPNCLQSVFLPGPTSQTAQ